MRSLTAATHTARLAAAIMASGAVSALYSSVVMAVQLDETLRRTQGVAQPRSNVAQKSLFGIEFPILGTCVLDYIHDLDWPRPHHPTQ